MSGDTVFTNRSSRSLEHAEAYTRALLDLVGDRDPWEVLRSTPASVREAIGRIGTDGLRVPEAPGKWSARQVVRHLADSELVWGYRMRRILASDRPRLTGFDQDVWADRLGYGEADEAQALEEFTALRHGHLALLERVGSEALRRVGLHAERGEESLEGMIPLYAGHDLLHLRQLERIRLALSTP